MLCNIVLVSAIQQRDSATSPPSWTSLPPPTHPTPLGWHRAPVWVCWVIQQIPSGCLFYTRWWCWFNHQVMPDSCNPMDGGPPGSSAWGSPGKNTGAGCHALLRYTVACVFCCSPVCPALSPSPPGSIRPFSGSASLPRAREDFWRAVPNAATQQHRKVLVSG